MSLTIYFLRHGETTASQTGGYCGTLDTGLTPEGSQMAEDLKEKFRSLFGPQEPQKKKNALPHLVSKNEIVQGEELRKMLVKTPAKSSPVPQVS